MAHLVPLKLVTVVADESLEEKLCEALERMGAQGWTSIPVSGKGAHSLRTTELEGRNVQIQTIVSEEVATKIFEHLSSKYFERYSVIAFLSTVEVLRPDKYRGKAA